MFTQKDILSYLEETDQETYHFFIDLEHPYFHTAGSRLTLFADKERWALVFEKSGYSNRGCRAEIELFYFGNCLTNLQSEGSSEGYTSNMKNIELIDTRAIEDDMNELVSKKIKQVKVRNSMLNIGQDKSVYKKRDINDAIYDNPENLIDIPSLIRYLDEEYTALFRASDEELRMCLPEDLPKLMHINEWNHEAYSKHKVLTSPTTFHYETIGKKPSDYETYKMIAEILVSKDITKWIPTLKPNNNWRNWPNAGRL